MNMQGRLDAFTEYYYEQLEALIGKRIRELAPAYARLQKSAVDALEQVYREMEAASAEKLQSALFRARLQEAYLDKLIPELNLLEAAQQPYFTSVLSGTLQYGYYNTAFILEKAARLAVTVPVLTKSGVLGLIANPWLPDRHTYSDRLRVNTALVAQKTQKTVEELVAKRLSYNQASRRLSAEIGESYYNATRLVRTEMTRASSLGTSYGAMENADILDGKYWDATLDSRTAPMDAANDRKVYDLDYDTPLNPGVPGQRIPNHPNCRCRWVQKLAGLNPVTLRTARMNDTKGNYGPSELVDAATYDDYAKLRGLPSTKEMLERDDPKRYLRPGETVGSLGKTVERRDFGGHTVITSRAPWDEIKTTVSTGTTAGTGFTPAKSVKEATAWGRENLGIDYVDYTGFDVQTANAVNETLYGLRQRFPQVTDTKIISTSQTMCAMKYADDVERYVQAVIQRGYSEETARKWAATQIKRKKVPGNTYAWSTGSGWGKYEGITFNKKWVSKYDDFAKSLASDILAGYHPVGTGNPASVLTHEFGHQLDYFLTNNGKRGWIEEMYRDYRQQVQNLVSLEGITDRAAQGRLLSAYADKNSAEFFAEAFTEWIHNPEPRPIARAVGEKVAEIMKGL